MTPPKLNPASRFQVFSRTDVGKRRQRNEDSLGVIARHGIFVVADGMGGVDGGDYSSQKVVSDLQDAFRKLDPDSQTYSERLDLICDTVNASSAAIREEAGNRGISGMGTTFVAICFDLEDPTRAMALHVGDSRVYRFRHRNLEALTKDHSLAAESGISDSMAIPMFMAGVITRAVGVRDSVEVERTPVVVEPGDSYMICSDGLYNMVQEPDMTAIFCSTEDPSADLVQAANHAGGFDNITVIVIDLPGVAEEDPALDQTQS